MTNFINFITVARIFLAPIILIFLIFGNYLICLLLFFLAGLTDYFDGYLARKYNAESQLGEIIDPIADKILIVFILIGLFQRLSPLTHFSHQEWSQLIEININCYWRILKELEPIIKNSKSPKIIFLSNSKISLGKPYHNILSISQAAVKTLANIYKSENKRLGIDTRIIESPNLESGITSMTAGKKKLITENFIKEIIKKSFA